MHGPDATVAFSALCDCHSRNRPALALRDFHLYDMKSENRGRLDAL
jgi:hypothetical protein